MGGGGWLPPGVTDKDIDDAAPGAERDQERREDEEALGDWESLYEVAARLQARLKAIRRWRGEK